MKRVPVKIKVSGKQKKPNKLLPEKIKSPFKSKILKNIQVWAKESQFVATTLSIVLTFGTANMLERCQRAEDRKMSALMVMSNIETFSRNVEDMSKRIAKCDSIGAWMLSLPKDSLDMIPPQEVAELINQMLVQVNFLTHDKSAETIFSSGIETWKNMGYFQFIDNVGLCFSKMNAEESNWNEWVNEYESTISRVIAEMQPGEHTLTKLLNDNVFRQKVESFHVRKSWLDYLASNIRYLNSKNMMLIGIDEDQVMAFTDERSRYIVIDKKEPQQADFRTGLLNPDSLTTLRPVIQHIDSIIHNK